MKKLLIPLILVTGTTTAGADEFEPQLRAYFEEHIAGWVSDPQIISSVMAQNAANAGLSQADIDTLDQTWRAEVGASTTPTIDPVLNGDAAEFLRAQVDASDGVITEIFTMDQHGLNVAASSVTSDYWQGDEDKFSQTYMAGAAAVHIGDVEFDESTQSYAAQVSVTLVDPASGTPIGAMTVGLNAEELF